MHADRMEQNAPGLDCGFLEVTINSNRLMSMLDSILKQLAAHASQIAIFKGVLPTIKQSVQNSLEMTEARVHLHTQKMEQSIRADLVLHGSEITQLAGQIGKISTYTQRGFKEQAESVKRVDESRKRVEAIMHSFEDSRKAREAENAANFQKLGNDIEQVRKDFEGLDTKFEDQFEMVLLKVHSLVNAPSAHPTPRKVSRLDIARSGHETKRLSPNTAVNWAQFSTKMQEVEKRIGQKQQLECINKVMSVSKGESLLQPSKQLCQVREEEQRINQMLMEGRSRLMDEMIEMKKELEAYRSRQVVLQEKNNINSRKIEKESQKVAEIRALVKKQEEKHSEEQLVEILRSQIKQKIHEMDEEIERKIYKETFNQEKQKLQEKILILQENLTEKAEKGDMKKAFLFLEDKIKQIIVLMAGDQGLEKDGALRKMPVKCLSCDKGLDVESAQTSRATSPHLKENNGRSISRNIRKRMHLTHMA